MLTDIEIFFLNKSIQFKTFLGENLELEKLRWKQHSIYQMLKNYPYFQRNGNNVMIGQITQNDWLMIIININSIIWYFLHLFLIILWCKDKQNPKEFWKKLLIIMRIISNHYFLVYLHPHNCVSTTIIVRHNF